jgi:undecaprenyl-diphosphatase
MTFWQAILLGALQGLAEFLPVSSSGHLLLLKYFFGLQEVPLLFDLLLHVATLSVVTVFFRNKIWQLIRAIPALFRKNRSPDELAALKMIGVLLIATLITGVIGLAITRMEGIDTPRVVCAGFLLTALVLVLSSFIKVPVCWNRGKGTVSLLSALITGFAQGIGVLPGVSRSGITISAATLSGTDRETAGEFSFILSIPAILGALLLDLKDAGELFSAVNPWMVLVACLTAAAFGFFALVFLMRLIRKGRLWWFALYLVPLGILGLIFIK